MVADIFLIQGATFEADMKSTKNLLVKSYLILKDTISPIKSCDCKNKNNPLVCRQYSENYVCEFNSGEFTVNKTIYVNCKVGKAND